MPEKCYNRKTKRLKSADRRDKMGKSRPRPAGSAQSFSLMTLTVVLITTMSLWDSLTKAKNWMSMTTMTSMKTSQQTRMTINMIDQNAKVSLMRRW